MRYDIESDSLYIDASELVDIARRRLSRTHNPDGEERSRGVSERLLNSLLGEYKTEALSLKARLGDYDAQIIGTPDAILGPEVVLVQENATRGGKIPSYLEKQVRGELFIYGLCLCEKYGLESCKLTAYFINTKSGATDKKSETVSRDSLLRFYNKCLSTVSLFARPEIERVKERRKTMREIKFPFREIRDGQGELVRSVYRNLARGTHLFACAPTGTGKTVSVIYPALRAIGDGRIEKVFYLTPKTTAREAAVGCINLLCEKGLKIKAVSLIAKEKICTHSLVCREDARLCPENNEGKLADAVMALYDMDVAVIGSDEILKVAHEFGVCSYELSLAYSEICDLIICDLNYVFDTAVYLRRFFDEGGSYGLLIDEAHNLESRAREMYSAEISTGALLAFCDSDALPTTLTSAIENAAESIYALFYPYLKDSIRKDEQGRELSFTHLSEIPSEMYTIVYELEDILYRELLRAYSYQGLNKATRVKKIKDLYYDISKLSLILDVFDEGYKLLLSLEGGSISSKLFCIDTGKVLKERLKKASSAIFFSATLEPLSYYSSMLGGTDTSDSITLRSPFDPECLSVTIMDKISTRYSERERTAPEVCRVIAATMSAKRGHYMVFCPSFEYCEMLYRKFTAKYPKISAVLQTKDMTGQERAEFLSKFKDEKDGYLVGFCVMGGIYSEGIDLVGDSLIGAVVVGIGMPSLSYEREAIAEYFEDKLERGREYAYIYPGMNRVFQAAGRVIRREDDRGVIVLIDDRFDDPVYKKSIPDLWRGMRYCDDAKLLREIIDAFWELQNQNNKTQN